jgi:hypothetical protein
MAKIIVFSGHGEWMLGNDAFVPLPAKCSMKFYTLNMKTLSDAFGGDLDRGMIAGVNVDQEANQFMHVPDMKLFPPFDPPLLIRAPDPTNWHVVKLPAPVPADNKNLQVQIKRGYEATLSELFPYLHSAIEMADEVVFIWAACRAINLKPVGGENLGVNVMQR